jgi:predicted ATPase
MAFDFEISGFRSFKDAARIKLGKRFLFVVGRNNVGKSNVLAAVAIAFNEEIHDSINSDHDFFEIGMPFDVTYFADSIRYSQYEKIIFEDETNKFYPTKLSYHPDFSEDVFCLNLKADILISLLKSKFSDEELTKFSVDKMGFGTINHQLNILYIVENLGLSPIKSGTISLLTLRHLTKNEQSTFYLSERKLAGKILSQTNLITTLVNLERENTDRLNQIQNHQKLKKISSFMGYCLELSSIILRVTEDREKILVTFENQEPKDISTLGTGIEQLLIIAVAALGFEDEKIILIEEPELNLHPRVQKRMIQFLHDNSNNQFVITTHSAAILDAVECDILHVTHDGEKSAVKYIELDKQKFDAVTDLGYHASDLVQSNFVIWVEGPSDRIYLKRWIEIEDESLIIDIHYSILFYGGRLLSHLSSDDESVDNFINILTINRNAAMLMDSDYKNDNDEINETKLRIKKEFAKNNQFCWVTQGREIENYIDVATLNTLKSDFPKLNGSKNQFEKIYDDGLDKNKLAHKIAEQTEIPNVMDLREKITELVAAIKKANL